MRIMYVHPRLEGPISEWSGLLDPQGRSPLLEDAQKLGFNALWFSPFFATSNLEVERHGKKVSGSLYAITDHAHLDREFSAAPDEADINARGKIDDAHIRHFTKEAAAKGITVMGDLVFNHVARDHPLVLTENAQVENIVKTATNIREVTIKNKDGQDVLVGMRYDLAAAGDQPAVIDRVLNFKFKREADYKLTMPGAWGKKWDEATKKEIDFFDAWDDVAPINYESPEAYDFFVSGKNGQKGYWKQQIDWYLDRGFTGFRCDACYMVPPKVWSDLAQYAHTRTPGVVFMGETLGDGGKADALKEAKITVNGQQQQAFDLVMLPTYWWNFKDGWMIQEEERLLQIARLGGAGFPDNLDTNNTIAGYALDYFASLPQDQRDGVVSDICLRDYAVATLVTNSVYMQRGYEYCRKQISVFRDPDAHAYWQRLQAQRGAANHALNLTTRIRAINDFKEELHDAKACVKIDNAGPCPTDPHLLKIECRLTHSETKADMGRLVLFINEKPENGVLHIKHRDLQDEKADANLSRLVLGPSDADPNRVHEIHDIAAFYTPLPGQPLPLKPAVQPDLSQQFRPAA